MCRLFGIVKDTYYNSRDPKETLNEKYTQLKPKIESVIKKNPGYGYPRLKVALKKIYGEVVNHKLLQKLLKLWGLRLKRRIRVKKKSWVAKVLEFLQERANLLRTLIYQNVIIKCFQVLVSDVTEIIYGDKKAYLSVHMDYAGKKVYGWSVSLSPDVKLVLQSFKSAIARLKNMGIRIFKNIIMHQDRGSVYTSTEYITTVLSHDLRLSYSRKGEPGDNAVNESFFSRFKEEWRDVFSEAKDYNQLCRLINKAINYHNDRRYHSSIGYDTPTNYVRSEIRSLTLNPI